MHPEWDFPPFAFFLQMGEPDGSAVLRLTRPTTAALAEVALSGVAPRLAPRRHYAYVFRVTWSDGSVTTALRSHNELFHLQVRHHGIQGSRGGRQS
jgi:hypothetical protein